MRAPEQLAAIKKAIDFKNRAAQIIIDVMSERRLINKLPYIAPLNLDLNHLCKQIEKEIN